MKINFIIYWFEDDLAWVDAHKANIEWIKNYLKWLWFNTDVVFYFDQNPITSHRYLNHPDFNFKNIGWYENSHLESSAIDFNKADLVLMDFNLSDQAKWDAIIQYIRDSQHDFFTEILFYAEWQSQDDLRKKANRDGLYCAERDIVFDKLNKVIKTLIKKSQDLNNLRGLVMTETSEIDWIMKEIVRAIIARHSLSHFQIWRACAVCSRGTESHFQNASGNVILKFNKYHADTNLYINELMAWNLYGAISSYLASAHNNTGFMPTRLPSYQIYQSETYRNLLAHNPEDSSTSSLMKIRPPNWTLVDFDEQKFIEIRQKIQKYKDLFTELKSTL